MRRLTQVTVLVGILALLAAPALADTLVLKNGERMSGYYEGGTVRLIKFRANDGLVREYDILSVQELQFGDPAPRASTQSTPFTPAPSASASGPSTSPTLSTSSEPRLTPGSERVTRPTASNAANTGFTIPTGSKVSIRMIDSINSETNQVGETFTAVLETPLSQGGLEVVPRGADVRGRIANINEAGRVAGKAELGLELTQILVNGIPYSITTSEYQEVGESRGGETAKRVGGGAVVGAIIGAVAGGAKGAAVGAGVGAGAGTAVQVLTKGEKLNIPSETKLEFTLRSPLVVAAR